MLRLTFYFFLLCIIHERVYAYVIAFKIFLLDYKISKAFSIITVLQDKCFETVDFFDQ